MRTLGRWVDCTHDSMQVGLHELFVEVDFVEISVRTEDDVHVVETCNLSIVD